MFQHIAKFSYVMLPLQLCTIALYIELTELATSYSRGTVTNSSLVKAVYNPKAFILHAASLHQGFPHCGIFSTAATRRCLGSISVPVRRVVLSHPLLVVALVSRYLTN